METERRQTEDVICAACTDGQLCPDSAILSQPRQCSEDRADVAADGITAELKRALRREKTALRNGFDSFLKHEADEQINQKLIQLAETMKFDSLTAYVSDGREADLTPVMSLFLNSGRSLFLPRWLPDGLYEMVETKTLEFHPGKWGIPEPDETCQPANPVNLEKSLWLIPGVAFDETCMRLGRGKGIYDRLLCGGYGLAVGVFYEFQKCKAVPAAEHDHPLDMIVTDKTIYRRHV